MSRRLFPFLLTCLAAGSLLAAETAAAPQATPYQPKDTRRHEEFVQIAKAGGVDVVFFGDSITDFWRRSGKAVWAKSFAPLKAANFGIGGEGTTELLWRVQNGELAGIHPKLIVLLIGTNNMSQKAEVIAGGINSIISEIQMRSPGTRILLLGIFPRGPREPDSEGRKKIDQVNTLISACANPNDPNRVIYLDIGDKFLNADRSVNKDLLPDTLHPNEKGYEVLAGEIAETVSNQLK